MIKNISAWFGLAILLFAGLAFANTATVTSATGNVQAQTGTAPARVLRVGDLVRQGDTVVTGQASAVVLRFEDGQVAALTANSRMTITAYQYNPQTQGGNILLSLIDGGMRAITGLIGRRTPDNVAYRAATATIGIRGTDITLVTSAGNVVVTVAEGVISFRVGNQPAVTVTPGNAAALSQGEVKTGPATTIINALPAALNVVVTNTTAAINQLAAAITTAINTATTPAAPQNTTIQVQTTGTGGVGASCTGQNCTCPPGFVLSGNNCVCPAGQVLDPQTNQCRVP